VSAAGDINGDGLADLIVGARRSDSAAGTDAGRSYVVFGQTGTTAVELSAIAAGTGGFVINGQCAFNFSGSSVSAAGDVNGDGLADLIIGAAYSDPATGANAGRSYVIFGSTTGAFSSSAVDHMGTAGADFISDEATSDHTLVGGAGNDSLTGNGGADVIYAGAGDDSIFLNADNISALAASFSSGNYARVDGGSGIDTLSLSGSGVALDLTAIANQGGAAPSSSSRIESIEKIDLTGSGNNSLTMSAKDVIDMAGFNQFNIGMAASVNRHQVVIDGNSGDTLSIPDIATNWTYAGTVTNGANTYGVFNNSAAAQVLVSSELDVLNYNDAPTGSVSISGTATQQGETLTAANTLADADGLGTITYTWKAGTTTIGTGITYTLTNAEVSQTITVTASYIDGHGTLESVASSATGIVTNINDTPTIANPLADQNATEDSAFSFTVPSNSFNDIDAGDTLSYAATLADGSALPAWLSFNPLTRAFSGTPVNGDVGLINVKVTATDTSTASVSDTFAIIVGNANDAPTVANPIADQSATEDSAFSFTVPSNSFNDIDAGDTLSYAATLADGSALPAWLSFNPSTRAFSGTPVNGDVGSINVKVTATDIGTASVSDTFAIMVGNANDAPTVANPIADQSATEDSAFSFTVPSNSFNDIDAGDTLSYAATLADGSALPAWLSFNPSTRAFSGTPVNGDVGSINVKVTATDIGTASVSDTFAIIVGNANDAPTVVTANTPVNQSALVGTAYNLTVEATAFNDVDIGDSLVYSVKRVDGSGIQVGDGSLPAWLTFDAGTRSFSGTPAAGDTGKLNLRVTATDTSGASASDDHTLVIKNPVNAPDLIAVKKDILNGADITLASTLNGVTVDDLLNGGAGADIMKGGKGDDTYMVDNKGDKVTELAGGGTADEVQSSLAKYTLGKNVENLTLTGLTGTGNLNGTGNELINTLTGNDGNNILDGGKKVDIYIGGDGDDTFLLDDINETDITEYANEGSDTIKLKVNATGNYQMADNVEKLLLTGTGLINVTGNDSDNTITGNLKANQLDGGAGNDSLIGNSGNDSLSGGLGNDSLSGGLGKDTLTGGDGVDTFIFNTAPAKANVDTITDFVSGTDVIELDGKIFKKLIGDTNLSDHFETITTTTVGKVNATNTNHLLYDSTSGSLYYDVDGSGNKAAVLIGVFVDGAGNPAPVAGTDFVVV
jgi:Ca2+-binding RTX toxin-like protein